MCVGIISGIVLGVAWAFLRPGYTGEVVDGIFTADPSNAVDNVEFTSFMWFVVFSAAIGSLVASVAYAAAGHVRGLKTMLWLGIVAAAGSFTLLVVGQWVTYALHPLPDEGAGETLEAVTLVPPIDPLHGWVAAPLMAVLTYWIFAVITLPEQIRAQEPLPDVSVATAQ
ncbi:hypothetical protein [Corynebacterium pilosum]|uniref:hypothetical protein n=1 Tax=Corynebacterium pilosum TaxID=35756 RepID=UPI00038211AC|nr:hypothetical protein [Corynebacterium pilosum]